MGARFKRWIRDFAMICAVGAFLSIIESRIPVLLTVAIGLSMGYLIGSFCEHLDLSAAQKHVIHRSKPPQFPYPCVCCGEMLEDPDDRDWHGVGNCVDICDCTFMSDMNGKECPKCRGEGSVQMARNKGLVG